MMRNCTARSARGHPDGGSVMSEEQPTYTVGQQVNGYYWTGTQWLPVPTPKVGFKLGALEITLITLVLVLALGIPAAIWSLNQS